MAIGAGRTRLVRQLMTETIILFAIGGGAGLFLGRLLMSALIPLLPFAGFVVNAFLGKRLPKPVSGGLACLVMLGAFGVSVASVFSMLATPDRAGAYSGSNAHQRRRESGRLTT